MITPRFEKESFWLPKGFVLPSKMSPFTMQKDSFYNAKGVLLQFLSNPIPHSHGNESQYDAAAGI